MKANEKKSKRNSREMKGTSKGRKRNNKRKGKERTGKENERKMQIDQLRTHSKRNQKTKNIENRKWG